MRNYSFFFAMRFVAYASAAASERWRVCATTEADDVDRARIYMVGICGTSRAQGILHGMRGIFRPRTNLHGLKRMCKPRKILHGMCNIFRPLDFYTVRVVL